MITHQNPSATVYGSGEWGDQSLKSLLDQYPQAVSISGHSHFSILDERSIYQDKFTAFTTQSIAYLEMERDKFDAFRAYDAETNAYSTLKGYISCPPEDTHVPMCLIMDVGQEKRRSRAGMCSKSGRRRRMPAGRFPIPWIFRILRTA